MANETIGHVQCPFCSKQADVRKNKKLRLYIACPIDGLITPALPHGQAWILDRVKMLGAPIEPGKADEVEDTVTKPAPKSAPAQPVKEKAAKPPQKSVTETPARKGLLDYL